MKNKKKIILSAFIGILSIGLIGFGTYAHYKSNNTTTIIPTMGTVEVKITDENLTNPNNINPGDNDPTNPSGVRKGTNHDLTFKVTNHGNKSVVTRHVLDITVDEENLHPSTYMMLKNNVELPNKYYIMKNGDVVEASTVANAFDTNITAVRYIINSDSFNGVGTNAETENSVTLTTNNYSYQLGMKKEAKNIYQGKNVFVKTRVEAMQYRNTKSDDWKTVFESTFKGTVN